MKDKLELVKDYKVNVVVPFGGTVQFSKYGRLRKLDKEGTWGVLFQTSEDLIFFKEQDVKSIKNENGLITIHLVQ